MSEAVEKPKSARLKAMDKTVVESYREYLDMDTDEEEFDRQETPEAQDEAPVVPDKPNFTDDELNSLIEKTKELTVLPGLSMSDWNEQCLGTIREYFLDPAHTVLSIFFHGNQLHALLGFPVVKVDGLVYFLRQPWQVYRPDHFKDDVVFGSVSHRTETAILRFVDGLYAPLAFKSNNWPHTKRDEVFTNLNDFLIQATEVSYKSLGILKIYVPWEATEAPQKLHDVILRARLGDQEITRYSNLEEQSMAVNRLEKCAKIWVKQIRRALLVSSFRNKEPYDIRNEFEFWQNRFVNLFCISKQLRNHQIETVIHRLFCMSSPTVDILNQLILDIQTALEEAKSNLILIEIVLKDCDKLIDLKSFEDFLPKILYDVIFVASESSYYSNSQTIQALLCSLITYIVELCIQNMDVDSLFDDTQKCLEVIRAQLEFCHLFSKIYDEIDQSCFREKWNVSKEVVFKYSKAFKQRCFDCLEICEAITMHTSLTKVTLGGTRGDIHEIEFRQIKAQFARLVNEMKARSKCAMQITNTIWFLYISSFRAGVADLENSLKNLFNELYDEAENIDTVIEILFIMMKLKDRQEFSDNLQDKWVQVWQKFYETINSCRALQDECEVVPDQIKLSQRMGSMSYRYYLTGLHKMMIDASDWLGDCHL